MIKVTIPDATKQVVRGRDLKTGDIATFHGTVPGSLWMKTSEGIILLSGDQGRGGLAEGGIGGSLWMKTSEGIILLSGDQGRGGLAEGGIGRGASLDDRQVIDIYDADLILKKRTA